jgi:DNA-binding IscR family transcriptional regulator
MAHQTGASLGDASRVLDALKEAGLVEPDATHSGAFRWRRDPAGVSLYEIAEAVGERFQLCCWGKAEGFTGDRCADCPLECVCLRLKSEVIDLFRLRKLDELLPAHA